jgi:enediyne biosynthesis protein E4
MRVAGQAEEDRRGRLTCLGLLVVVGAMAALGGGTAAPAIRFEDRQAASRVDFVLNNGTIAEKPIVDSVPGGVAVLDFDRDGFLDLFFTNGATLPGMEKSGPEFHNRLYRNNHDGTFTDVTAKAGVAGAGYSMGVAVGDYDNDGYPDIYVAGVNRNILYHNNRNGTFSDVTARAGVAGLVGGQKVWAVGAAWLDYDNDGKLDLFVSNYIDWSMAKNVVCGGESARLSCTPALYKGLPNILYRNNGNGTFTDVSAATGVGAAVGKGMGLAVADYDGDGFTDIFVANDNERNFLFHNLGGRKFEEVSIAAGVAFTEDGVPASSMGVDFRDLTEDGRPDVVLTALAGEVFSVRLNAGGGLFDDYTYQSGLGLSASVMSGWSVGGYDFDNDGRKDVFLTNSHVSENVHTYSHYLYKQHNAVFRNLGKAVFANVSEGAGLNSAPPLAHRGAAFGDLNNDGAVDVVTSSIGGPVEILMNTSAERGHWLIIALEGTRANRDGIGAQIKVTGESGAVEYNHVTTSVGYLSASDKRVHFGLGADTRVREIEIRWPGNGRRQVLRDVAADQVLKVKEPAQ